MLFRVLLFLLLPNELLSSPSLDQKRIEKFNETRLIDEIITRDQQFKESKEYNIYDNYYPLLLLLISLPSNETESLERYLSQKTYAELKRMIDEKQKENDITIVMDELERNNTDLARFISEEDNRKYVDLVEAYHNASIYNAIRGVWNSKVNPLIPPIDQLAILEYFADRKSSETLQMSFWARLWAAVRAWLSGHQQSDGCNADRPLCVRRIVERMPMESRIELDKAADEEENSRVEGMIAEQLSNYPPSVRIEFDVWSKENEPPTSLREIVHSASDIEKQALDRLRKNDLIHSLKDYYRAMIEGRNPKDQEELRQFFQRMNDTFARCFNPIRGRHEFY